MCIISEGDEVIRSLGPTLAIDPKIQSFQSSTYQATLSCR